MKSGNDLGSRRFQSMYLVPGRREPGVEPFGIEGGCGKPMAPRSSLSGWRGSDNSICLLLFVLSKWHVPCFMLCQRARDPLRVEGAYVP